jgi:hypothetical protein
MVYFQGIFPVWTSGRKRKEKDLIESKCPLLKTKEYLKLVVVAQDTLAKW